MCDPLVGGLIAGAASLGASAMQASANADLANKQQEANNQWLAYQQKIHQEQVQAENEARQKAEAARQDTLSKVTPQAQAQQQTSEQQRLNSLYSNPQASTKAVAGAPDVTGNASDLALTGQDKNVNLGDLTQQVNNATSAARARIAALATAGSYGGTFGGLGTVIPDTFRKGANAIQLQNDIRQGNIKTYGVEQQVQPLQYTMGAGGNMMGDIGKALGGIAGTLVGNTAGGGWGSVSMPDPAAAVTPWTMTQGW